MKDIQKFSYEQIVELLEQADVRALYEKKAAVPESDDLIALLKETTHLGNFEAKSVLGIDVYQYSQYNSMEQSLVPFLFKLIYKEASALCLKKAGFVFQKFEIEEFKKRFIDTGDGGFQIFDTPLHAVIFAINFELFVRYYNSYQFYPKLRKLIGPLSLRYALTHDQVFKFDENYYGPSIINCNRILSKDNLNRFLIDENTFNWYMLNISGLENLQILSLSEIQRIKEFEDYEIKSDVNSMFPEQLDYETKSSIIGMDVQKIGNISVKASPLSIYNVHMQYMGGLSNEDDPIHKSWIALTIGNLNTSGIG